MIMIPALRCATDTEVGDAVSTASRQKTSCSYMRDCHFEYYD